MTPVCKLIIQPPEDLDNAERRLRDRLRNITARRRNSADSAQGRFTFILAEADNVTGAFIELCDPRCQIGRVTFFARHLFQTAGHFAQCFCPARSGVCDDGDVITHVAEVFADGDAGIDGCFARGNRHIRRIGDQNGSLHQALACFRVF